MSIYYVIGDRGTGAVFISAALSWTGELNRSCVADLVMGMHAEQYYYAGGFDDWFLDTDSSLTAEDLAEYFKASLSANGGDMGGPVDALSEPGSVTLRQGTGGAYPATGQLLTKAAPCALSGTGRVSVTSEYTAGVTSVAEIETATSDDLEEWSAWQTVGVNGELQSPNRQYIRFRVTLTMYLWFIPHHPRVFYHISHFSKCIQYQGEINRRKVQLQMTK